MSFAVKREKLAAVLSMMGSQHDGEVLNAARLAEKIRRSAGLSWSDLLTGAPTTTDRPLPPPPSRQPQWREMLAECRRRPEALTDWERQFVASVAQRGSLSPRQLATLADIARKARAS